MRLISGMAIPLCLGFIMARAWSINCPEIVAVALAGLVADLFLALYEEEE